MICISCIVFILYNGGCFPPYKDVIAISLVITVWLGILSASVLDCFSPCKDAIDHSLVIAMVYKYSMYKPLLALF